MQSAVSDHDDNFPIKLLVGEGLFIPMHIFRQVRDEKIYLLLSFFPLFKVLSRSGDGWKRNCPQKYVIAVYFFPKPQFFLFVLDGKLNKNARNYLSSSVVPGSVFFFTLFTKYISTATQ